MKTIKTPFKTNKSLAVIIPDAIVKYLGITEKSRLTIISTKDGFRIKVRA